MDKSNKSISITHSFLLDYWDYSKNLIHPNKISHGSKIKVWWVCNKGHSFERVVKSMKNHTNCPYCLGQLVLYGFNDLETGSTDLVTEWNYERNLPLRPSDVTKSSKKKVYWICSKGHEWSATIGDRTNKKSGCPYCSGKLALKGENDFFTKYPDLIAEWDYVKNFGIDPNILSTKSAKVVWWKCTNGHEWKTPIYSRSNGHGCPYCFSARQSSYPEYALLFYLEKYNLETIHRHKINNIEVDLYLPQLNIAIEYDGYYWHKDKKSNDIEKSFNLKELGLRLIRIRENGLGVISNCDCYIMSKNSDALDEAILWVFSSIGFYYVDIVTSRDEDKILESMNLSIKNSSIFITHPELLADWDYLKNKHLSPKLFSHGSNKKVWWLCQNCNYEFKRSIRDKISNPSCPVCKGKDGKTRFGINDLGTINPSIALEWDYGKNDSNVNPRSINYNNSISKFWWTCPIGHSYSVSVRERIQRGSGCPYCAGKKVLEGFNDVKVKFLEVEKFWDYSKNDRLPSEYTWGSSKKVYWICKLGHSYISSIKHVVKGQKCPVCLNRKKSL